MGDQENGNRVWRSRWAAIGAAVAVSLGAGGVFFADAASPSSSVVMVTPVRILDTRDPVNVGLNGPFVSAIGQDLQVTGLIATTGGPATVVPTGATGVILNATVVGPTASGFLSVRPADAPGSPATSNLNFLAGQLVPNAVTVQLPTSGPDAGRIEITYDAYGVRGPTTDVLVDVVGYTVGAAAGDSRVTALETQLADLQTRVATIEATTANSRAVHSAGVQNVALNTATDVVVRTVTIVPTANGKVIATASATLMRADFSQFIGRCSITSGSAVDDSSAHYVTFPSGGTLSDTQNLAGTRGFDVVKDVALTVRLVCDRFAGSGGLTASSLTAVFAPN